MGALDKAQGGAITPGLAAAAAQAGAPGVQADPGAAAPPPAGPAPTATGAPPVAPPGAADAPPAPPGAASPMAGNPGSAVEPYLQQGDEREQKEYERAMRAMAKVLYGNDKTANAIVDQVDPNDIIGSTSKVGMLFIKELDRKINMDEAVIAEVTRESVERITELAEARHRIEYKAADMEKVLGSVWEGVQSMFGNEDVEGYTQTVQGMKPQDLQTLRDQQDQILGQAGG